MIAPADLPREALLSKDGETIRLESNVLSSSVSWPTRRGAATKVGTQNEWITGRAGMEYRDLIPGRLGGKVIASHIRLTTDGEVPDYVHYHKIEFQMIYCLRGRIRVVYEDQGPPFWLEVGDCVLQPPEIRHRVLESQGSAEVIEIGVPAAHETWVEHEIKLPTTKFRPERDFSGQRFLRHVASETKRIRSNAGGLLIRDTGILAASGGIADVWNLRLVSDDKKRPQTSGMYAGPVLFYFILKGDLILRQGESVLSGDDKDDIALSPEDCFTIPRSTLYNLDCSPDIELLRVVITRFALPE